MVDLAVRRATYEDILQAPPEMVAEVIEGVLYVHPRPASPHALAASSLGMDLGTPFQRGRGGPGGWWIVFEPELHVGSEPDILVPDLAGWRRERLPQYPKTAFVEVAPDWVCEVLSESTRRLDRVEKMRIYARERVQHVWLVDPIVETIEVFALDGTTYRVVAAHGGDERPRLEPFEAIELDLSALWGRQ